MTREEASNILDDYDVNFDGHTAEEIAEAFEMAFKALEQDTCEMTAEEYRQRMIQAFHNADTDELIAICALPTEKEFEHLEWLLKNHYKKETCEDAVSRQDVLDLCDSKDPEYKVKHFKEDVECLPPVTPTHIEQEPCEDVINREDLDECKELMTDINGDTIYAVRMSAIRRLPPVTPTRKKGKWIPPKYDDGMSDPIEYQVRCSMCGFDIDPQTYALELKKFGANKYCPNCGAEMEM